MSNISFTQHNPKKRYNDSISNNLSLSCLKEYELDEFFSKHDEVSKVKKLNNIDMDLEPMDFIHFIWMGNPLKEEYKINILQWKELYPNKKIIIWVDQEALDSKDIKNFAETNNIRLIKLEKVFTDASALNLNETIRIEKDRLSPNWGAASDIYRYLIMYYFGGIYSDTDVGIKARLKDQEINFDFDLIFSKDTNDVLITKNIKDDFWKNLIEQIPGNYATPRHLFFNHGRREKTICRTGPTHLYDCLKIIEKSRQVHISSLLKPIKSDVSWLCDLTDKKCKELSEKAGIVDRIIRNILIDLKDKNVLDLTKYDKIIEKITKSKNIQRNDILMKVKNQITELIKEKTAPIVENIFAKTPAEYQEFSSITSIQKKQCYIKAFTKAAKRKNLEMFKYLFENYPNDLFPISSNMMKLILQFNDKNLFTSILNYANSKDGKINLTQACGMTRYIDVDLALDFFEQIKQHAPSILNDYKNLLPKSLHTILSQIFSEENQSKLLNLKKFLNIIPLEMLAEQDEWKGNGLSKTFSIFGLHQAIKIIKTLVLQQRKKALWDKLLSNSNLNPYLSELQINWE